MDQAINKLKEKYDDRIKENELLAPYTTLKIGGPARAFFEAKTGDEVIGIIRECKNLQIPFLIIGGGSNLLVSDEGTQELVIRVNNSGVEENYGEITVQAGTPLQQLVDFTIEHELDGMSTMTGIPGTVGGAVYGSAGAYGDNIRNFIKEIKCFDGEKIVTLSKAQYDTGYRDSIFKKNKNLVILEVKFSELPKGDVDQMKKQAQEVLEKRKIKYNPEKLTPGSFFKNIPETDLPADQLEKVRQKITEWESDPEYIKRFGSKKVVMFEKIPAGNLIDMLGGKGDRLGQIIIDDYHANTFINLGGGTAKDFWTLAKKWRDKVNDEFGVELQPEVQFVNLPPFDSNK